MSAVFKRIRALIDEKAGGNLSKFSRMTGIPYRTLHYWTTGTEPAAGTVLRIESAFGLPHGSLLGEAAPRPEIEIFTFETVRERGGKAMEFVFEDDDGWRWHCDTRQTADRGQTALFIGAARIAVGVIISAGKTEISFVDEKTKQSERWPRTTTEIIRVIEQSRKR